MRQRDPYPPLRAWEWVVVFAATALLAFCTLEGTARGATATWYGPGLYGNRFACANQHGMPNVYHTNQRGIAHRSLPCGTRVGICTPKRCVITRVIDRGPYSGADIDLTARTAMDLCACIKPYTMQVRYNPV